MTRKIVWVQAGFRLTGIWFFLDGGLSLGLRLAPGLFPGKFYSFSFPANLLSLLIGPALFFAAPRLAAFPLFTGSGGAREKARWNEDSFLKVLFPLAGIYIGFKVLPMTPALGKAFFRKRGYLEAVNSPGLLMLLSFGIFLALIWYFLTGAPGIRKLAAVREEEGMAEGGDTSLSRREVLECLLRVSGSFLSVQAVLILLQAAWGGGGGPYGWGKIAGAVLGGALGVFLLVKGDLPASLLLRDGNPGGDASPPGMAAFLEAGFLATAFWFLVNALVALSGLLFGLVLGTGSFPVAGNHGSWWTTFWNQYGGQLTNLALSIYVLADTRRRLPKILGSGGGEDPGAEGPLFARETAGTAFLLGGLLLGVYFVEETLFGLPVIIALSMSQWIFLVILSAAALLLFFGAPVLSNLLYKPGGEEGLPPRPAFSILDPFLRFLGLWLLLRGLMALPVSVSMWATAPQDKVLFVAGILQNLLQCLLGVFLLFDARRALRLLPGSKSSSVSVPREEGAA